jgi:hypothetical protein
VMVSKVSWMHGLRPTPPPPLLISAMLDARDGAEGAFNARPSACIPNRSSEKKSVGNKLHRFTGLISPACD